jgi:transketolase
MDPFTIKPLDITAVQEHAAACGGRVVTVEDHYPEGGLGDAVLASLATCRNVVVRKLAVTGVPRSGDP